LTSASIQTLIPSLIGNLFKIIRIPFGRKLLNYEDRFKQGVTAQFEIVPEDQMVAEKVAVRYVSGERLEKLSEEVGIPTNTLRKIITDHAGPKWKRRFKREIFGIDEQFETDIPELFSEGLRNAVLERVEKNRTLDRDYSNNTYFKNRYLLKGFVFCGYCDRPFYGKVLKSGDHFYYHNKPKCGHIDSIKGIRLEPPVLA
jgi:hypothetical protein